MEFQDVVRRRRMVRAFTDEPLPSDVVDRILANAIHTPSAGFSQGWAFLVLEGREQTDRFWANSLPERESFGAQAMFNTPLIVVPLSHKQAYLDRYAEQDKGWEDRAETRWPAPYWDIDTGMAALLMLLTATDAGLGALFFGILPDRIDNVRAAFGVPAAYHPIGALAIGYARARREAFGLPAYARPPLGGGGGAPGAVVIRGRW